MSDTTIWPKRCSVCNSEYDVDDWEKLQYCGLSLMAKYDMGPDLEHRICNRCTNDLAQPIAMADEVIIVQQR